MKPEGQTIKPEDIFCFITLSQTLEAKIFTEDLNNQSGSTVPDYIHLSYTEPAQNQGLSQDQLDPTRRLNSPS